MQLDLKYRDPKRYDERKRRLKMIYEGWRLRMLAARGQGPQGYKSPSRMPYGQLAYEYNFARERSRWYRGFCKKPIDSWRESL